MGMMESPQAQGPKAVGLIWLLVMAPAEPLMKWVLVWLGSYIIKTLR